MSHQENNDEPPMIHYEGDIPVFGARLGEVERKQAEAETRDEQNKRDQIALDKRVANATVALVIATIVIGIFGGAVGGIQLWYIHRQWKLTSDGLSKMGDQLWAAKDAAQASKTASETASNTLGQMQAQTVAQGKAAGAAVQSNTNAQRNFAIEERPYVWFSAVRGIPLQPDTQVMANVYVVNYGKTLAVHEQNRSRVFIGKDALPQGYAWFSEVGESWYTGQGGEIVHPGIPADPVKDSPVFTTAVSIETITKPEAMDYPRHASYMVVVFRSMYMDTFGNRYRSDWCVGNLSSDISTAMQNCPEHNDIK